MTAALPTSGTDYEHQSLLEPVTVRIHDDLRLADVIAAAWATAADSVPITGPQMNLLVQEGRKAVAKPFVHTRGILTSAGTTEYPWRARLCTWRQDMSAETRFGKWVWEVGARPVIDSTATTHEPAVTARLDVTGYRFTAGRIESAAELALFRHYFAEGVRAIDPDASINGAHAWRDDWWTMPT